MPLLTFFPVVIADAAVAAAAAATAAAGPNTNTRKNYKSIRQRNAKCAHVMQAAAATPATATVATVAATFLEYVTQPQLWTVDTGQWTMDTGLGAVLEATLELKPGLSRLKL